MAIVIDIECVASPDALAAYEQEEREPPANYKSDDAVARWREKDRAAWAKDAALNPRTGRIVCMGLYDDGSPEEALRTRDAGASSETDLVREAVDTIAESAPVVSFNGQGFDLPSLYARAQPWRLSPLRACAQFDSTAKTSTCAPEA